MMLLEGVRMTLWTVWMVDPRHRDSDGHCVCVCVCVYVCVCVWGGGSPTVRPFYSEVLQGKMKNANLCDMRRE